MKKKILLLVLLYLQVQLSFGQRTETAVNSDAYVSHLIFEGDNDVYFNSDKYYTAGEAISYTHKNLVKTPAQFLMRSKNESDLSFTGFGIEHRMFTPHSIKHPYAISNDRPYASYLMITNFSVLIKPNQNLKMSTEIGIGILGPAAGGEQIQIAIHQLIDAAKPIGWDNQLNNALIIDYRFRIEKGFFTPFIANHFIPIAEIRAGTLKNKLALGLMLKFGKSINFLPDFKSRENNRNKLHWNFVFEAKLQEVFFDATLQGGLMNGDQLGITLNTQNVSSGQVHLRTGLNLYFSRLYLRFMINYNTKDFMAGSTFRYLNINVGFAF